MVSRSTRAARMALLGEVIRMLRQRRRAIRSILIHPDSTIEVMLALDGDLVPSQPDDAMVAQDEIAMWLSTFERD